MILSMGIFAIADTLVKLSASFLSPPQVMFFLFGGALVMFTSIALLQGENLMDRRAFAPVLWLRYAAEVTGMIGMVTALALVPISTVGAITQATPILASLGAVLFLNETIGWRRWCSILLGFAGILLIVRPGAVTFDYSVLWAVLALAGLSIRDLTTPMVPRDMPAASLAAFTMAASVPFPVAWILLSGESLLPAEVNWSIVLPMAVLGGLGYLVLIKSLRTADVSVVMPFRYTRIVFLIAFGVWVFDERPDSWTLAGASLIIGSGTYLIWRERRLKRQSAS